MTLQVRTYPNGFAPMIAKEVADAAFGMKNKDVQAGLTAQADATLANATQLNAGINQVATVAGNDDSVKLPPAEAGMVVVVGNQGASRLNVFTYESSDVTINATAGSTGVTQNTGVNAIFFCISATLWIRILSA